MRLVFVHGRGQGGKDQAEMLTSWKRALDVGLSDAGFSALPATVDVRLPFYGTRLDEFTTAGPAPGEVVLRGSDGMLDPVAGDFVIELAHRSGISDEEIAAELDVAVIERGPENEEWVQAAARLLSKRIPWLGKFLLGRLTADVSAYLRRPDVTTEINDIVAADIGTGPAVVVAHSLGTLVAYNVLRKDLARVEVPLLVTLGSPLGIDVVKRYLARPLGHPESVKRWVNAADPRDPVALYDRLGDRTFPAEIENLPPVTNPEDNPHGIDGYLRDSNVCRCLMDALGTV